MSSILDVVFMFGTFVPLGFLRNSGGIQVVDLDLLPRGDSYKGQGIHILFLSR